MSLSSCTPRAHAVLPALVAYVLEQARGTAASTVAAEAFTTTSTDDDEPLAAPTSAPTSAPHAAQGAAQGDAQGDTQGDTHAMKPKVDGDPAAALDTALAGEPIHHLIDAYCGSGLFALAAAAAQWHGLHAIVGVEVSASAVEAAWKNAEANGASHVRFLAASAERIFDGLEFDGAHAAVIVDPPRKGCDETFLAQLVRFAPRRIVYVSCSPDTQARDLQKLMAAGYFLHCVQPFDLFPQTRHLESVATLERSSDIH